MTAFTPDEDETLYKLFADGKSFSEIGKAMGRTKNSVISRSRKLKLGSRGDLHTQRMASRSAKMRKYNAAPKPKQKHFSLKRTTPRERKPPMFLRVVTAPDSKPVPLVDRTGCCYPTTPHGPHLFCNEPTQGRDYCEFHHSVMYKRRAA